MHIPLPGQLVAHWLDQWAVEAQQRARRNAMIASTDLAQRRAERLEVEQFLDSLEQRTEIVDVPVAR